MTPWFPFCIFSSLVVFYFFVVVLFFVFNINTKKNGVFFGNKCPIHIPPNLIKRFPLISVEFGNSAQYHCSPSLVNQGWILICIYFSSSSVLFKNFSFFPEDLQSTMLSLVSQFLYYFAGMQTWHNALKYILWRQFFQNADFLMLKLSSPWPGPSGYFYIWYWEKSFKHCHEEC